MSQNNQPQIALDFDLRDAQGHDVGCMTIAMSLAKNALPYTIERLRACGWTGRNILDLKGIEDLQVNIDVFVQKDPSGRDRLRAEVLTGGGAMTFKMKQPIPLARLDAFAAYVTRGIEAMPPPKTTSTAPVEAELADPIGSSANDEIPF
jgi:hypothetical protein